MIAFICNHCPDVSSAIDRLAEDARVPLAEGIGFAAICSNDAAAYSEDGLLRVRCAGHAQKLGPSRCGSDHAAGVRRELVEGMWANAATGRAPGAQYPYVACPIKRKAA